MDFWSRIDAVADRWNVLRHPFYVRWTEGELTPRELTLYAGQYAHAVAALASATRNAADRVADLTGHAAQEESHIELWDGFARAVGCDSAVAPLPETAECAAAWSDPERELPATLVALYAIESAQPAISETKRAGLTAHYGVETGPGTAYFDLHATLDAEHAEEDRALIVEMVDDADEDALVAEAERVLHANWHLLDAVERACASRR